MKRMLQSVTIAALLLACATRAGAAPILLAPGGGFPAPGGTTFSSSGSLIGEDPSPYKTRFYSGFDTSQWSELYFNLTAGTIGNVSFTTDTTPYTISGNTITWLPSTQWSFATAFGPATTSVKLVTTFTDWAGNALNISDFILAPMAGMPGIVLDITAADLAAWGGGFQVRQVYQTLSGEDAANYYNERQTFGGFNSSTSAAFYYSPSVPEPTTLGLMGLGLAAAFRRRRTAAARLRSAAATGMV